MAEKTTRHAIAEMAKELKRPIATLLALAPANDPFYAGETAASERDAKWFATLFVERNFRQGIHLRRIHYVLVSIEGTLQDGSPYRNTVECWQALSAASKPARYLGLVDVDDFDDRRAPAPRLYLPAPAGEPGIVTWDGDSLDVSIPYSLPDPPKMRLYVPTPHLFHVEIWCEKSAVDDVLNPIGKQTGCNIVTGVGEMSITACKALVERARHNGGRPVRIGYLSDFDPAGQSMPVATARKIEFFVRTMAPDLDIQVEPIALTFDQCVQFKLPRTPIKESERRAQRFEERFGAGATELDALEALHPGALRTIVLKLVDRYRDKDFEAKLYKAKFRIDETLDEIRRAVVDENAEATEEMEDRLAEIREDMQQRIDELRADIRDHYADMEHEMRMRARDVEIDLPTTSTVDEIADPLFNSKRDYVEQIDRFKLFQGKPTARRSKKSGGGAR